MKAGIVLVIAGVWVAAQTLEGGVLDRLLPSSSSSSSTNIGGAVAAGAAQGAAATSGTVPATNAPWTGLQSILPG